MEEIIDEILADIAKGGVGRWSKSWAGGLPTNAQTKKIYTGINMFLLSMRSEDHHEWAGYQQWKKIGGHVRKGEKATKIVTPIPIKDKATGEMKGLSFRRANVWHKGQIDGLPEAPQVPNQPDPKARSIHTAQEILGRLEKDYHLRIKPHITPAYDPLGHVVLIPGLDKFNSTAEYYHSLFHEVTHWTGHKLLLDRETLVKKSPINYATEELVAEFVATAIMRHCHFAESFRDLKASEYIAHWISQFPTVEEKRKGLITAITSTGAAFNLIKGEDHD